MAAKWFFLTPRRICLWKRHTERQLAAWTCLFPLLFFRPRTSTKYNVHSENRYWKPSGCCLSNWGQPPTLTSASPERTCGSFLRSGIWNHPLSFYFSGSCHWMGESKIWQLSYSGFRNLISMLCPITFFFLTLKDFYCVWPKNIRAGRIFLFVF